jgi:hypothetical protein
MPSQTDQIAGLKQGVAELGYVEGQNVVFELRDSGGTVEPLSGRVASLGHPGDASPADLAVEQPTVFGLSVIRRQRSARH